MAEAEPARPSRPLRHGGAGMSAPGDGYTPAAATRPAVPRVHRDPKSSSAGSGTPEHRDAGSPGRSAHSQLRVPQGSARRAVRAWGAPAVLQSRRDLSQRWRTSTHRLHHLAGQRLVLPSPETPSHLSSARGNASPSDIRTACSGY